MSAKKSIPVLSLIIFIAGVCGTAEAATPTQIEQAIEDGVAWLAAQQTLPAGSWGNSAACTGFALTKLQERAFELGYTPFDPCYPYKENVEKGLKYLFSQMSIISISTQPAGNPDTDGDGNGVYMNTGNITYETGIALMAIAASRAPNREVNSPGSPVHGWTYKEVLQDMVDYMAFGQIDSGSARGGWGYAHNEGWADNSNSGYAVFGLGYAESPLYGFNCAAPQFVKDELKFWIDYIQTDGGDDDGSSGYDGPGNWVNILKTGNLVFQMTFAGIAPEDPNFQRALAYIGRKWNEANMQPGWKGPPPHYQATYCTMKGLSYSGIETVNADGIPVNWFDEFTEAIVPTQQGDGSWPSSPCYVWPDGTWGTMSGPVLATEWALLTLEKSAPPSCRLTLNKVDDVNDGNCVGPGDYITYTIDYNYPAGPNLPDINDVNIIDYLPDEVDFNWASDGNVYDPISNTVIWNLGTLHPGDNGSVTLKVKVKCVQPGSDINNYCEIRSEGEIYGTYEYTPVCNPTLTKDDNIPSCVGPGGSITYSICFTANGYGDKNVIIIDDLPDELDFVSATGEYVYISGTITWDIGDIPPDAHGCITLVVQVNATVEPGKDINNSCILQGDCINPVYAYEKTTVCPSWCPVYVDANAAGGNNGYSWEHAFNYLQDALKTVKDFNCNEIRVAQGKYWPDANSTNPNGTGIRTATFQLINGVAIYGGFPPGGGAWEDRNPALYETILSGDLAENDSQISNPQDMLDDPSRAENSYHVVTASGVNNTAVLDSLVITGGNANYYYPYDVGGGMYNYDGNPTVKNCQFIYNAAIGSPGAPGGHGGGGMYNYGADRIANCLFKNNWCNAVGGAIFTADLNIVNCTFIENGAGYGNVIDAMGYMITPKITVTNCILWDNQGGQISEYDDVNVTYSDVQGGWVGEGNIDEDPILEADGYHLTMCSPCIGAGTNTPPGGLESNDIDGQPRIMDGRCIGEAIVDMGADEYYTEDCNDWLCAYCERPATGSTAYFYIDKIELSWVAGTGATQHKVFFGTDYTEVANAATNSGKIYRGVRTEPNYPLINLLPDYHLIANTVYYWRVDEVNETNIWKGTIWNFTMGEYVIVDDFSYYSEMDMKAVWRTDGEVTCFDCGEIDEAGGTATLSNGAMRFYFDNSAMGVPATCPWSEVKADNNGAGLDMNWTVGGLMDIRSLAIGVDGNIFSDIDPEYDRLYAAIEDSAGNLGIVYCDDAVIQKRQFGSTARQWNIDLDDPCLASVDLNDINAMYIGTGPKCGGGSRWWEFWFGGTGVVTIDNIRLYMPHCVPEKTGPAADFTGPANFIGDCLVDFYDLAYFAGDWLLSDVTLTYSSASQPPDANLTVWYAFDETSGSIAQDSTPFGRHGTIGNYPAPLWGQNPIVWDANGLNGTRCLNLESGFRTWLEVPTSAYDSGSSGVTFSFWSAYDINYPPIETFAAKWASVFLMHEKVPTEANANTNNDDSQLIESQVPTPWPPTNSSGPQARFVDMRTDGKTAATNRMRFSVFGKRWNHYAFVYDDAGDAMRVYLNGELLVENTSATNPLWPAPGSFRIGTRSNRLYNPAIGAMGPDWGFWGGKLDDFRVYNYALNENEIQWLATNGTGTLFLPLVEPTNLKKGDITPERVNFGDFAVLASEWMAEDYWP